MDYRKYFLSQASRARFKEMEALATSEKNEYITYFLEQIPGGWFSSKEIPILLLGIVFAEKNHKANKPRKSGEPYITHPIAVALILIKEFGIRDLSTILVALFHDLLEDNVDRRLEIDREMWWFGKEVVLNAYLLDKNMHHPFDDPLTGKKHRYRSLIKAVRALKAILVKIADRLHNLQTLKYHDREKQLDIVQETIEEFPAIIDSLEKMIEVEIARGKLPKEYADIPRLAREKLNEALFPYCGALIKRAWGKHKLSKHPVMILETV